MTSSTTLAPPADAAPLRGVIWCTLGVVMGLLDFLLLSFVGVEMRIGTWEVTFLVCLYFSASFGGFAYLLGRYKDARDHLRKHQTLLEEKHRALLESQDTIRSQLEALLAAQHRADENEKLALIGQMAASIAHEVRNPLGVIRSSTSLLLEDLDPQDERHRAGEFILEEIKRLNRFCTDLLQYARPLEAACSLVYCDELMLHIEHLAARLTPQGSPTWRLNTTHAPSKLWLDQDLWLQAMQNILQNAVQVLDGKGAVEIHLFLEENTSIEPKDASLKDSSSTTASPSLPQTSASMLCVEILDDGPGVSTELSEKIFTPFFTTRSSGTGLGLALARRIAEAHKGTLLLSHQRGLGPQGAGACFVMRLPQPFVFATEPKT